MRTPSGSKAWCPPPQRPRLPHHQALKVAHCAEELAPPKVKDHSKFAATAMLWLFEVPLCGLNFAYALFHFQRSDESDANLHDRFGAALSVPWEAPYVPYQAKVNAMGPPPWDPLHGTPFHGTPSMGAPPCHTKSR